MEKRFVRDSFEKVSDLMLWRSKEGPWNGTGRAWRRNAVRHSGCLRLGIKTGWGNRAHGYRRRGGL